MNKQEKMILIVSGEDSKCHENDEALQDATFNLDDKSLRLLFKSVELTDKNGNFPLEKLIKMSTLLDELFANNPTENINRQFLLLYKTCPEFATCQNSTIRILKDVLLSNKNLKFNRCVANRVYNKADKEKRPILFVYIDSNEFGKKFYFADKNKGQFVEFPQKEFVKQFECYERDLQENKRNQTMGN